MADETLPSQTDAARAAETPPPPLTDIRITPPRARGLNRKAIIATAGGAGVIILGLASLSFSPDAAREPVSPRPAMSAPARPEMAKGAVGGLPASYADAPAFEQRRQGPAPPQLGSPLPGDIAAFAPEDPPGWGKEANALQGAASDTHTPPPAPGDEDETRLADRSHLFFVLQAPAHPPAPQPPTLASPAPAALEAQDRKTTAASASPRMASDRVLFPGTIIPASLLTAVNSEAPGSVIAQVTQTIYDSATGRHALIPQGARLLGVYRSATRFGQNRIAIQWSRLLLPDGAEIALDEPATDPSGAAALAGAVDDRWGDLLGAAALGTLINIGVASTEEPALSYGGYGVLARDPVDEALQEGIQRSASSLADRIVDRSLAIPPTIKIEAGRRISVMVSRRQQF